MSASSPDTPRPVHPGPPQQPRRIAMPATAVRHVTVTIAPGEELFAFAERVAAGFDGFAAMLNFRALAMQPVAIHVPEPDPTRQQIMRYGPATVIDADCELVSGQMSIGSGPMGPMLHGHAHVRLADGTLFGGHLSRGGCFVAPHAMPTAVQCTVFEGLRLEPSFDSETGFSLLSPVACAVVTA